MNKTRIRIESFGCSTNIADGETLAGCLSQAGFTLAATVAEADIVIYNCCSVKGPTENRAIDIIKHAPADKKIIVAGCLPLTSYERLEATARFSGAIGPAAGLRIIEVVNRVMCGEKVVELGDESRLSKPEPTLPRVRGSSVVSLVPVSYGCMGACAYCCVVLARGRLRSYTVDEIVARVRNDVASGAKEIWLTSQDMGCYGRDIGTNLASLLKSVVSVSGDFRVRVGMMTPNFALDILPELVEAFHDEKVFKFLHLPVQSGDDAVLRAMKRCYTVKDFKRVIAAFKAAFAEVTLATDVICGFPSETERAFENTLGLIADLQPDVVNVSKFFARPGTAAALMTKGVVGSAEIKRRSGEMAQLARKVSRERNRRWSGWTGTILVDEKGKVPNSWVGRNFAYKPVVIRSNLDLMGKTLSIRVTETFGTYLSGALVE